MQKTALTKIWLRRMLKAAISIVLLGACMRVNMSAYATTSTFTWKEEVLLHGGKKIVVERSDTYDSSMRHEIGQGAPLAEHKTTFMIPGTNQTVIWKSNNRPSSDPDSLHLLGLDFLGGVPYVATKTFGAFAYAKWNCPNPPYVFFKYVGEWKRISLEEFPEKFQINVTLHLDESGKKKVTAENRDYGFVRAQTVAEINREPGRSKESYSILRTPRDRRDICPEPTGPDGLPIKRGSKAPLPITPPNRTEDKK